MVILLAILAALATTVGGVVALKNQDKLYRLLGLTAGVVMGVVVFGLLPEIVELSEATSRDITTAMVALMGGFLFFQAEDGMRYRSPSRGLGDVYKRQA